MGLKIKLIRIRSQFKVQTETFKGMGYFCRKVNTKIKRIEEKIVS